MIDTSVWLECRNDTELRVIIANLSHKFEIRSSETIDGEINDAYNFLKKKRMHGAEDVKRIFDETKKATVRLTPFVEKLARNYAEEGRRFGLRVKEMEADLAIVAAASADGDDFILTLNRKTMASDFAKETYAIVNAKMKLRTPQFLADKISFRRLAYA